ncbi:MAG: hypothetical protein ACRDVL_00055 [Acidimicrobiia bacterium]
MRAMAEGLGAGPIRSLIYAVSAYLGTLAIGKLATAALGGGDSFVDLAVATLILLVLAPLAGLVGASVGFLPYRHQRLRRPDAALFWSAAAIVLGFVGFSSLWLDLPTGLTTLLVGSAALIVMRVALIHRSARGKRRIR